MSIPTISAAEAKRLDLMYYWTGRPCIHGHVQFRRTKSGGCIDCEYVRANHRLSAETAQRIRDHYMAGLKANHEVVGRWLCKPPPGWAPRPGPRTVRVKPRVVQGARTAGPDPWAARAGVFDSHRGPA